MCCAVLSCVVGAEEGPQELVRRLELSGAGGEMNGVAAWRPILPEGTVGGGFALRVERDLTGRGRIYSPSGEWD